MDQSADNSVVQQPPFFARAKYKKILLVILLLVGIPLIAFAMQQLQKQQITKAPPPTPTPTQEALLAHKAKQDMPVLLQTILQPAYIPPPQDATNVLATTDKDGKVIDENKFRILTSVSPNEKLLASIRYQNAKSQDQRSIDLLIPGIKEALTPTIAENYAEKYFKIKTRGTWKCDKIILPNSTSTICENFWDVKNLVKMGIGIVNPIPGQEQEENSSASVFFCELYKGRLSFTNKSCNVFKATTGVGQ